jgi:hypothetical protein
MALLGLAVPTAGATLAQAALFELETRNINTETDFRRDLHCLSERAAFFKLLKNGSPIGLKRSDVFQTFPKTKDTYWKHVRCTFHLLDSQVSDCRCEVKLGVIFEYDEHDRVSEWTLVRKKCELSCDIGYSLLFQQLFTEPVQAVLETYGTSEEYCHYIEKKHGFHYLLFNLDGSLRDPYDRFKTALKETAFLCQCNLLSWCSRKGPSLVKHCLSHSSAVADKISYVCPPSAKSWNS